MVARSADPAPTRIAEYRIVRALEARAGSATYLAHQAMLDRPVVLRFLPAEVHAARAILGAARALAKVSHPALCTVHRVSDDGARSYVVLEYAVGEGLETVVSPLPSDRVLEIGRALAGALAALHAAGIAHGAVQADRVVLPPEGGARLFGLDEVRPSADPRGRAEDVRKLVALLAGLAGPDLRGRIAPLAAGVESTAEGILHALGELGAPPRLGESVPENPYRGLAAFEAEDGDRLFGRQAPLAQALARLRTEPWLVVAAPPGSGRSSFVRAGLGHAIAGGALGERAQWDVVTVAPGARPFTALAAALARSRGEGRRQTGLLLVIDPLEDALDATDVGESDRFLRALEAFGTMTPGVRAVITIRADLLQRMGELDAVGRGLLGALFLLPAMRDVELREVVVGPARACGFEMESPAMVDALIGEVSGAAEALPLLSFALAELWNARDPARRVLPEAALNRLGGAAEALGRHGEVVFASLSPRARPEMRRILVTLTAETDGRAARAARRWWRTAPAARRSTRSCAVGSSSRARRASSCTRRSRTPGRASAPGSTSPRRRARRSYGCGGPRATGSVSGGGARGCSARDASASSTSWARCAG